MSLSDPAGTRTFHVPAEFSLPTNIVRSILDPAIAALEEVTPIAKVVPPSLMVTMPMAAVMSSENQRLAVFMLPRLSVES